MSLVIQWPCFLGRNHSTLYACNTFLPYFLLIFFSAVYIRATWICTHPRGREKTPAIPEATVDQSGVWIFHTNGLANVCNCTNSATMSLSVLRSTGTAILLVHHLVLF